MPPSLRPSLRPSPGIAVSLGLALMLFFNGKGAEAQEAPMPAVSVDMPQGGCRLSLWKDGQASISYGAMPRWVRVTPGTFDFERMIELLRSRLSPQGDDRPYDGLSAGTVALPGSEALRRIDDVAWVRSLLEQAWKARMAPSRDSSAEDRDWIAKVCSFAE